MSDTEAPLPILYRDDRYIVIHKPSGLLVHRSPIDRRETRFAIQLLRDQIGQKVYPAHRLDRPTSGILAFGLDPEAGTALSVLFQERRVAKTYLAVVRGYTLAADLIDSPLRKYKDADAQKMSDLSQDAQTAYRRIATTELPYPTQRYATTRYSLLELTPTTGRRHQIRRHLAHIRHPIIGDTRHGCNKANQGARDHCQINRLLLAATRLSFEHPFTKQPVAVACPLEDSFQAALSRTELVSIGDKA